MRRYEQIRRLLSPSQTKGNRRLLDKGDLHRLAFIRRARGLDFEVEVI